MNIEKEREEAFDRIHGSGDTMVLAVCIPSGAQWHSAFGLALALLSVHFATHRVPGYSKQTLTFINVQSCMLHQSRQRLIERALIEAHATHVLFVDSDQTFPPDTVHQLGKHGKMAVGANIVTRQVPMIPCAVGLDGQKLWTMPESTGLEEVMVCGTGVMLLNTRVFQKLTTPFFLQPFEDDSFIGEDVYFCRKLREAGYPIWIDHDLSKRVGHLGQFEYTYPVAWQQDFVLSPVTEAAA